MRLRIAIILGFLANSAAWSAAMGQEVPRAPVPPSLVAPAAELAMPDVAATSPEMNRETVGVDPSTCDHAPCGCPFPSCVGACLFDHGCCVLRLGKPDQYVPPQYGWTVMVPVIPPRPKPGEKPKPTPPSPWKPMFYDNNFRYLDDPQNTVHNTFDFLKRIEPTPSENIKTDFGGEFRWQGRGEDNRRLTGEQNNFNAFRERLYLDTWVYDRFRVYMEVIWADASHQTVRPVFNDLNHGDFQNAFGEYKISEFGDGTLSARVGWRQELLFGNQRLVSPLDWANARRTFDDVANALYRSPTWNIDAFWSRPNIILPRRLDQPDYSQQFFGTYWVYKGIEQQTLDFYYLGLLETDAKSVPANGLVGDSAVHTTGTRWQGNKNDWLWEIETAYQFGNQAKLPRNAGMATAGFGRKFSSLPMTPELWFYYDYASGNQNPKGHSFQTFNQLFPLGHKYFGYMDIVGRQNILDPNVFLKFYPNKRVNFLLWYHHFNLASAHDALYNAAGKAIRRDPTGQAGTYVGDELDFLVNFVVNPNTDFQIGVSHFFAGPFVQDTAKTPAQRQDGEFFYTQFTCRF